MEYFHFRCNIQLDLPVHTTKGEIAASHSVHMFGFNFKADRPLAASYFLFSGILPGLVNSQELTK